MALIPYHKQTSVPCLSRKHLHHKNLKALFVLRDSVFSPYYPGLPLPQDGTTSISICPASLFSHLLLPPALRSAEELHGIQPRRCPAPRLCPKEAREAALLTPHHAWSQPPRPAGCRGPAVLRSAGRGAGSGVRETRHRHSATLQKINKVSQVPESGTWVKMPPVHLLLIPEAKVLNRNF